MAARLGSPSARHGPDRCPGALTLHQAQDGSLARVRVPGGRLSARQLLALADAASRGNGLVDLTSRGNLQLRGLEAQAGEELSQDLSAAGLLPSPDHDRARNVIASPVPGRHPEALTDTDPVVSALDLGLCASPELAALPGRFLFAVDDGSGLALVPGADVTLLARSPGSFALLIAGAPAGKPVPARDAAAAALAAARAFLHVRAAAGSTAWRIAELPGGPQLVAHGLGRQLGLPHPSSSVRMRPRGQRATPPAWALRVGSLRQRDGRFALTALAPLGRLDVSILVGLASIAPEVRLSPRRTVTVIDIVPERVGGMTNGLERLGLVLDEASGWTGLTACAGLGCCPQARIDVRGAAGRRAAARVPGDPPEHWTACERGCGRSPGQSITVTATSADLRIQSGRQAQRVAGVDAAVELLAGDSG